MRLWLVNAPSQHRTLRQPCSPASALSHRLNMQHLNIAVKDMLEADHNIKSLSGLQPGGQGIPELVDPAWSATRPGNRVVMGCLDRAVGFLAKTCTSCRTADSWAIEIA